jgi:hypothetical protein
LLRSLDADGDAREPVHVHREIHDYAMTVPTLPRGIGINGQPGRLLDAAAIVREYGITRASAEALMRRLPKVTVDGIRKVWVRRDDLDRLLADSEVRP